MPSSCSDLKVKVTPPVVDAVVPSASLPATVPKVMSPPFTERMVPAVVSTISAPVLSAALTAFRKLAVSVKALVPVEADRSISRSAPA
ncbi:hypothetical protein D9M70_530410 [compost metagenome]